MPSNQPAAGHLAVQPQYLSSQPSPMAGKSEPNRNKSYDPRKPHITEYPITKRNWYKHVNWLNVYLIIGVPLIGLVSAFWIPMQWQTMTWTVLYYFATGLGITAGYHRLWAHTSYSATLPLRIFLAAVGGGAVEGSIRWWARDHRAHHRYTDTDKGTWRSEILRVCGHGSTDILRRSLLGQKGAPVFPLWLDGHEAEPKKNR